MMLYLDGALVANTTLACAVNTTDGLQGHIGYSQHGNGYHYEGDIEMVDIYDAAITAQQVSDLFVLSTYVYKMTATADIRALHFSSCREAQKQYPRSESGLYYITDASGLTYQAYCDMQTLDGGWMHLMTQTSPYLDPTPVLEASPLPSPLPLSAASMSNPFMRVMGTAIPTMTSPYYKIWGTGGVGLLPSAGDEFMLCSGDCEGDNVRTFTVSHWEGGAGWQASSPMINGSAMAGYLARGQMFDINGRAEAGYTTFTLCSGVSCEGSDTGGAGFGCETAGFAAHRAQGRVDIYGSGYFRGTTQTCARSWGPDSHDFPPSTSLGPMLFFYRPRRQVAVAPQYPFSGDVYIGPLSATLEPTLSVEIEAKPAPTTSLFSANALASAPGALMPSDAAVQSGTMYNSNNLGVDAVQSGPLYESSNFGIDVMNGYAVLQVTDTCGLMPQARVPWPTDGLNHHIVGIINTESIELYIDGMLGASRPFDTHDNGTVCRMSTNHGHSAYVGHSPPQAIDGAGRVTDESLQTTQSGGETFVGEISEVLVYPVALNSVQVWELFRKHGGPSLCGCSQRVGLSGGEFCAINQRPSGRFSCNTNPQCEWGPPGELQCESQATAAATTASGGTVATGYAAGFALLTIDAMPRTFEQAHDHCASADMQLASIHSEEQNVAVRDAVTSANARGFDVSSMWIGGTDSKKSDTWMWEDGVPMTYYMNDNVVGETYSNWMVGYPRTGTHGQQHACAEMITTTGRWQDLPCTVRRASVCSLTFPHGSINVLQARKQCTTSTWLTGTASDPAACATLVQARQRGCNQRFFNYDAGSHSCPCRASKASL
jgi:hypothetical protein